MARAPSLSFLRQYRGLQNPNPFDQIRNLVGRGDEMKQQQEQGLDEKQQQQYTEIARKVCQIIRTRPRWEHTLLSDFPSFDFFDPNCVCEIIKSQNNAFLCFRFFQWLCSQHGFSPDSRSCNALFQVLVEAKASNALKSFLHSTNFSPEPASLESFIPCLCEDGFMHEALDVFSQLKRLGYCPSVSVWNAGLMGSLRVGSTNLVWELYSDMMESGLVGDVETAGYLIQAFCIDDKHSEAYELLRQVVEAGHAPDNVAFNKLISGFCKKKNYSKVSELLHLMIAKNCTPDIFTYQEIIHRLCKNGMGDEGFRVFNNLKERGYALHRVTYTTMIDGLCKMGRLGEAQKLWFEMIRKGFVPNEYTYNTLIDGYCKTSKLEEAQKLYRDMCNRGYRESTVSYNTMIAGLCLHGRTQEACDLFEEMRKKGIARDVITYNTLIQGLSKEGKIVEATNFFHELQVLGLQPSPSSYTPLIQTLCEMGHAQEAIALWNDMQSKGVEPLVCTHDYIITGLCKQGNATEGMEWLAMMLGSKLRPQKKTFNRLLECLSLRERLDDALLVLDSMFGMGYTLGVFVCHSLVSQLCKENSHRAEKCLEEILERN